MADDLNKIFRNVEGDSLSEDDYKVCESMGYSREYIDEEWESFICTEIRGSDLCL